ncbi:hypothetical protein [Meiothermus ruber]|jgi:hypothetical protein|uniref:Uncharacterized protein n=1 Tax=Meiothermus ruber (strain ATCC 35948 / DSM 1279 / VKM B-1258 / 21) TaxID=504728 RepID=D3PRH6_MEIRD|nr:hypothetical protein [Meiothermus ruber]ADD28059.1 hypothetical protein Mrub_1297 [Meiothermus ruber DSM 1279]AGK04529.1 hypothetical protein K649_06145 [Meiothermus ruber DSM 1279]MCL6528771.1 hypothetical protein [Meiothermus ruber]
MSKNKKIEPKKSNVYIPADLTLRLLRLLVGMSAFLFLFYVVGHYLTGWPFPTPFDLLRIASAVVLGGLLGLIFSRFWPLPPTPGLERIFRIFFMLLPALLFGYALQVFSGANQALSIILPLSAWISSGLIIRLPEEGQNSPAKSAQ